MGLLLWKYLRWTYPSDESFHCDAQTLTISKVPWLDIHNKHWVTHSYALANVANIAYKLLAGAKGTSIYSLSFIAGDRVQRVLPGLEHREADKILKAIKGSELMFQMIPPFSSKLAEQTWLIDLNLRVAMPRDHF
jgi:hypothetical protein